MAPLAAVRAQSQAEQNAPPAVEATILAANAQKNQQMLDQAAVSYEQLRKWAEAQKLREASLAMAEQVSGQLSKEYAIALVKLGDLARKRGAFQESTDYYNKALELGDRPEAFSALINLGRDAFRMRNATNRAPLAGLIPPDTGVNLRALAGDTRAASSTDPAKAREYFQRARNVANNGNDMGAAQTWMAMLRQSDPDGGPEAESLYRGAMAVEDTDSAEQAITLELYAQFLKSRDRAAEAAPLEARAKTIRRSRINAMGPKEALLASAIRVGPGVKPPSLLYKVEPEYSEEARAAKLAGTVLLRIVVDIDGKAKDIEVVNGIGLGLDEQAVLAIQRWKFKPGEKDGAPVPVMATIEVNFKLM